MIPLMTKSFVLLFALEEIGTGPSIINRDIPREAAAKLTKKHIMGCTSEKESNSVTWCPISSFGNKASLAMMIAKAMCTLNKVLGVRFSYDKVFGYYYNLAYDIGSGVT